MVFFFSLLIAIFTSLLLVLSQIDNLLGLDNSDIERLPSFSLMLRCDLLRRTLTFSDEQRPPYQAAASATSISFSLRKTAVSADIRSIRSANSPAYW